MIMPKNRFMLLLAAFLLLPPATVSVLAAESPSTMAVASAASSGFSAVSAVAQEPSVSGLPERGQPPRTLRAYWHLFIAFAVTWLLVFGYALSIGRRFSHLEEELRRVTSNDPPRGR